LLASFLVVVFLTGGASRIDPLSLVILRPLSVLVCAAALVTLHRDHIRQGRWPLAIFAALFLLALLHLVPLPPMVWHALPGRETIVTIDRITGLGDIWRPLTLTPMNGWHALASLFAPLAVLLLGLQLSADERFRLLPVVIILAALSAVVGVFQVIGSAENPLYLYRITNNGWPVGLFANRNHGALLLAMLFPLLALFAATPAGTQETQSSRRIIALAATAMLLPLILVSGSRAGIFLAVFGLLSVPLLYRRPPNGRVVRRGERRLLSGIVPVAGVAAIGIIAVLMIVFSRAKSIDRLIENSASEDSRFDFWRVAIDMMWQYFPVGSGSGSFAEAYQMAEPAAMLNLTYLNRAHNDWLETAVTFGLPGLIFMLALLIGFAARCVRAWRRDQGGRRSVQFARLATVLLVMLALASVPDYPLRTPIMMCIAALCSLWLIDKDGGGSARLPATGSAK